MTRDKQYLQDEAVPGRPAGWTRRVVLKLGGGVVMSAWLAPMAGCGGSASPDGIGGSDGLRGPVQPTPLARFLTDAERTTLRALVDRLIPGDLVPGAADAEADAAIDAFLAAFLTDPPLIYAGGPFSDRAGAPANDFERFMPLDDYEALAWRTVIEGSQGMPEREFNGAVKGLQTIYREGLARLEERAATMATGVLPAGIGDILAGLAEETPLQEVLGLVNTLTGTEGFADLPGLLRDIIILDPSDPVVQELVDVAFPATLDGTYGAPEYGGNRDLVGWTSTGFDGDVHPRGYTDDEVINPDNPGLFDSFLPPSYGGNATASSNASKARAGTAEIESLDVAALAPMLVPGENLAAMIANSQGRLSRLRGQLAPREQREAIWIWSGDHA